MNAQHWHTLAIPAAVAALRTDAGRGLDEAEAARRLDETGPNELLDQGGQHPLTILWGQLRGVMSLLLVAAAAVSAYLGDWRDAAVIGAIIVLNAVLGFAQEYRAERAMAALRQLAVPVVRVRRGGEVRTVSARDLVPGDVALLEAGMLVPADGRLLEAAHLQVDEAALTGESVPVAKMAEALPDPDLALAERVNMVYRGTVVAGGRGAFLVAATGMATELGGIAALVQRVGREQTPLQRRLDELGRGLALAALALIAVVVLLGALRGDEAETLFLTAISLAVAAVPEGLPAVVTIALALGAQRMLARQALIRRLPAVETLGAVTVICTDKTGTLTRNRMAATVAHLPGRTVALDPPPAVDDPGLALLLTAAALCNDATPGDGEPTERALVLAAERAGLSQAALADVFPRVAEVPFDGGRKRMATVHTLDDPLWAGALPEPLARQLAGADQIVFAKGAFDALLPRCPLVWADDGPTPLGHAARAALVDAHDTLASDGLRVLAVAARPLAAPLAGDDAEAIERDLALVGLIGLIDPPRPEVLGAVRTCREAGIRPVMITGDGPLTAQRIARDLAIAGDGQEPLTGRALGQLGDGQRAAAIARTAVYARVAPEDKLDIVTALQARGEVVAMTGDGVNDAPALKRADIGVAMGQGGTDVAKEAADLVLQDDHFATIVAAVEEGRRIYDNLRKFVKYLLASNCGEIVVMLAGPLLGLPLPLLPIQILWINLVTDGLPALALSLEPAEPGAMRRPPRPPRESIFARGLGADVLWIGALIGAVVLGAGLWAWDDGRASWRTLVFTVLTGAQMGNVLALRSEREPVWRVGLWTNPALLGAVALTVALQLAVVYVPFLRPIFDTVPLTPAELALAAALSAAIFVTVEVGKVLRARVGRPGGGEGSPGA